MTKKEYLDNVKTSHIDSERIKVIENLYHAVIDGIIANAISYSGTIDFFDEERRALSFDEIKNADSIFGATFVGNRLVPVIDAYDNDFIVYSIDEGKWGKVNLSDMIMFKKRDTLDEVI